MKCFSINNCQIISLALFLSVSLSQAETNREDKELELENIRTQIKDVETRIKGARDETEKLHKELRENELNSADTLTRLHHIESNISNKRSELEELKIQKAEYNELLSVEKIKLTSQIRAAYQIGRNDYLKLVLNQEDPASVGRALAYYDYHNRARTERINDVKQTLISLNEIENLINSETNELESLKQKQESKLTEFYEFRASRNNIITKLQKYIDEKDVELQTLQENERRLGELFQDLKQEKTVAIDMFEDMPSFNALKGKLKWPIKGKFLNRFGHYKKGGNLKWQGVLIDADSGTEVKAISTGKVVFADWFRNLGLLIIIDHGDGYMSLYGHNQNLLKNTGDWVLAGEQIATVGDSGGQNDTALYFEIRKGAQPLNPANWCRG